MYENRLDLSQLLRINVKKGYSKNLFIVGETNEESSAKRHLHECNYSKFCINNTISW